MKNNVKIVLLMLALSGGTALTSEPQQKSANTPVTEPSSSSSRKVSSTNIALEKQPITDSNLNTESVNTMKFDPLFNGNNPFTQINNINNPLNTTNTNTNGLGAGTLGTSTNNQNQQNSNLNLGTTENLKQNNIPPITPVDTNKSDEDEDTIYTANAKIFDLWNKAQKEVASIKKEQPKEAKTSTNPQVSNKIEAPLPLEIGKTKIKDSDTEELTTLTSQQAITTNNTTKHLAKTKAIKIFPITSNNFIPRITKNRRAHQSKKGRDKFNQPREHKKLLRDYSGALPGSYQEREKENITFPTINNTIKGETFDQGFDSDTDDNIQTDESEISPIESKTEEFENTESEDDKSESSEGNDEDDIYNENVIEKFENKDDNYYSVLKNYPSGEDGATSDTEVTNTSEIKIEEKLEKIEQERNPGTENNIINQSQTDLNQQTNTQPNNETNVQVKDLNTGTENLQQNTNPQSATSPTNGSTPEQTGLFNQKNVYEKFDPNFNSNNEEEEKPDLQPDSKPTSLSQLLWANKHKIFATGACLTAIGALYFFGYNPHKTAFNWYSSLLALLPGFKASANTAFQTGMNKTLTVWGKTKPGLVEAVQWGKNLFAEPQPLNTTINLVP